MPELETMINDRVHDYYWNMDMNCASTTLKILSEIFMISLNRQVKDAATGMHGAGQYGAQCGLVEGALMFIGIIGRAKQIPDQQIIALCRDYARQFEARFHSLICRELRPRGFNPDNPPHLCEPLTRTAIRFDIHFISDALHIRI
ncbi:MAG: C-GCAxxG-C-C family protein [Desulfobacterales bacterium]|nr:C-GCAxxG-C-C family protein [Desulfobacterales bacterium]MDD4071003.1 C-GCAxxG-C-C family protein [Desulfobacterales bacterium]MDD4391916.1 C-GCAxxG-C-C family protein [Desulfobacterales bacterium]